MKKVIKGYNNFDVKESFFSRENEEDLTNDNSFSESEEDAKSKDDKTIDFDSKEKDKNVEEEELFDNEPDFDFDKDGDNDLTFDNDMVDVNDDKISDDIQQIVTQKIDFDGFNPNISMLPKEWSIVKHMTDHGVRIGMCYSNNIDDGCEEIKSNLDYETACQEITKCSTDLNIPEFDSNIENYLGGLNKSIINKKSPKTSYGE